MHATTTLASLFMFTLVSAAPAQDVLWTLDPPSSTYGTNYSTVYDTAFPYDTEVADDFEATGQIESLYIHGRGCGNCTSPIVDGVYVRLYEWTTGGPGALQSETFIEPGSNFTYGGSYPYSLTITMPEPVQVGGWHYLSIQVAYGETGGVWRMVQTNRYNAINGTIHSRDRLAGDPWAPDVPFGQQVNADIAMTIYGTAAPGQPVVSSVSNTTFRSSDRIEVFGSGFGPPGDGDLVVNGQPAITTYWSSTHVIGYAPEGITTGAGNLTIVNLGVAGNSIPVTVLPRTPDGQVRWSFEGAGSYASFPPAIGPDGTVYFDDIDGFLYAMTPGGGLLWITDAMLGQQGNASDGPIAIGDDGTVYVGTNPLGPTVELVAFNPDGSHRWTFTIPHGLTWQAGPSIGPDGRIYGAINAAQLLDNPYDVFAVNPDGTTAWTAAADPVVWENAAPGSSMAFGPSSPGGPIDQMMFTADGNGAGRNYGFDISDGDQNFAVLTAGGNDVGQTQLVADARSGRFYMMEFGAGGSGWGLQSFDADGDRGWAFDPGIASGATHPALDAGGAIYFGWDLGRISAVEPDGSERWTIQQSVIYNDPVPSPTAPLLFAAGNVTYNAPAFIEARSTTDGSLLWEQTLTDDFGGDVGVYSKPQFAPDGQTAYFTALQLPITPTSTYRVFAIDTSDGPTESNPADVNGDGTVDVGDLIDVIIGWGPCPPGPCPADTDDSGEVDVDDLLSVIMNWD